LADKDKYYIEVLGKALDVLETFSHLGKRQLTLREVHDSVRLNRNSVFRILYTLAEHGYITKSNKKYELGPKLLDLSNATLKHRGLLSIAGPALEQLRDLCGETVNLGVLVGQEIRYIGVWESIHAFRVAEHLGARDFLHCSALGKACLAFLPFREVRELLRKTDMPRQTEHTITSLSALKAELEVTRARGYAVDMEESRIGACCVGVPILGNLGSPLAAISVSGPISHFKEGTVSSLARALLDVTADIQSKLGTTPLTEEKRAKITKANAPSSGIEGTPSSLRNP